MNNNSPFIPLWIVAGLWYIIGLFIVIHILVATFAPGGYRFTFDGVEHAIILGERHLQ